MLAGELYDASDPELSEARVHARRLTARLNASDPGDRDARTALLRELLGDLGDRAWIEPPFHCDYGWNISLGDRAFVNFDCVFLDCAPITIGADTMLASAVQLCPATHPIDAEERASGLEYALPIAIGEKVWIGAGVVVGPGVAIGDNTVVGAGSVVLRDVPANVVAAGSPCRVLREL
jgi:maltose O-acetyltransferase